MKKDDKLKRIKLLNFMLYGESIKENFDKTEVKKLKQTSLNEVREELKEISDDYFDEIYCECEKKSKSNYNGRNEKREI